MSFFLFLLPHAIHLIILYNLYFLPPSPLFFFIFIFCNWSFHIYFPLPPPPPPHSLLFYSTKQSITWLSVLASIQLALISFGLQQTHNCFFTISILVLYIYKRITTYTLHQKVKERENHFFSFNTNVMLCTSYPCIKLQDCHSSISFHSINHFI